ncbi:MAG: chorismate synthase [Planctomycetaceae bacterium]|jgi:chorismate synthase|nr:chorismate synthase [Planctomycetaceae bacterium]
MNKTMYYKTAGESHGQGILALVENFPAGLEIDKSKIDAELRRRQGGYGRGGRQKIETDTVEILTGIWQGKSTGAPITLWIRNRDCRIDTAPEITQPRPGHADLAGSIKYGLPIRPILERASARETAGRVAAGALAKQLLEKRGIIVAGFVRSIGSLSLPTPPENMTPDELLQRRDSSEFYTVYPEHDTVLKWRIDEIGNVGDTVGGVIEVRVFGVPIGLGSCMQWDAKLDGKLAQAVMSIQAMKGVEIGLGFESARTLGSAMHDPIAYDAAEQQTPSQGFVRKTNNAGGIEGGMSNGQPIIVRAAMKPIPTLKKPLDSIDLNSKQPMPTIYERSDVCAVPAASVVVENVIAFEIVGQLEHY